LINEIKEIVQNYLNNAKLCTLMIGTIVDSGIMVNEKLTIPNELIIGNLKECSVLGDKVRFIRNHGGREFYIIEIIDKAFITKASTLILSMNGQVYEYKVEDVKI
jgi:hypothetical protein